MISTKDGKACYSWKEYEEIFAHSKNAPSKIDHITISDYNNNDVYLWLNDYQCVLLEGGTSIFLNQIKGNFELGVDSELGIHFWNEYHSIEWFNDKKGNE